MPNILYSYDGLLILFQVHSDFVAAATRGAVAVIDGNVMAINPGEEAKYVLLLFR